MYRRKAYALTEGFTSITLLRDLFLRSLPFLFLISTLESNFDLPFVLCCVRGDLAMSSRVTRQTFCVEQRKQSRVSVSLSLLSIIHSLLFFLLCEEVLTIRKDSVCSEVR